MAWLIELWFNLELFVHDIRFYFEIRNLDPKLRRAALIYGGHCPDCRAHLGFGPRGLLIPGPQGGAAQNFYCGNCEQGWNIVPMVGPGIFEVQEIGAVDPELIERYRLRFRGGPSWF